MTGHEVHCLFPTLVHELGHWPGVSPQWRCQLLLTVRTGEEVLSLLDVLPASFQGLPETLDVAAESDIAVRIVLVPSVREWVQRSR